MPLTPTIQADADGRDAAPAIADNLASWNDRVEIYTAGAYGDPPGISNDQSSNMKGRFMKLLSDRLVLRPWADADAPALFELARDPRVGIAAGWPPHESEEQSHNILRNVLRGPEQYAITLREGGQLIGAIGLLTRDSCDYLEANDEYSVGYWIGVPYWGQGFAAEALHRLIDHARDALGARAIYADHFLENAQSHRVMEKCGLSPVRTQAAEVLYPAGRRDILIMRRVLAPHVERSPMHHPMKQLPERAIGEDEAREILRQGEYCVVATVDEDGHPYATPLSYVLDGDELLIHTGVAGGQKTEDWERDPRVCVTVAMDMQPVYVEEDGEPGFFTTRYASVIATGTVRRIEDAAQARRALAQLCLKYCPEHRGKIGAAIEWELPATVVWAIDLEHISGKAGRRIPNGKGAIGA